MDLKVQEAGSRSGNDPDIAIPSQEAPYDSAEAACLRATQSHKPTTPTPFPTPRFLAGKCAPADDLPIYTRRTTADRSSAPPDSLGALEDQRDFRRLQYLDPFSADILPPPTAPLYLQIITYMQRWGVWANTIDNEERRMQLITFVANKMENVWLTGIQKGLIPESVEAMDDERNEMGFSSSDLGRSSAHKLASHIIGTMGRKSRQQLRRHRPLDPSRQIVLGRPKKPGQRDYGITGAELAEAGVTTEQIVARVVSRDLDEEDELMQDTLEQLDVHFLERCHWYMTQERTQHNIMGRDLEVFCLWEVQNSRAEIKKLENLKARFTQTNQIRNTQVRLDAENELHSYFLALALILHEKALEDPRRTTSAVPATREDRESIIEINSDHQDNSAEQISSGSSRESSANPESSPRDGNDHIDGSDEHNQQQDNVQSSMPPSKQAYIDAILLPKINEILQKAEHPLIPKGTPWADIREALRYAGINIKDRNDFVREMNDFKLQDLSNNTQTQVSVDTMVEEYPDLPTRTEIVEAIPAQGLSPVEFNSIFGARVDPNDTRWPKLVQSVAYRDKRKNRWFKITKPTLPFTTSPALLTTSPEIQSFSRFETPAETTRATPSSTPADQPRATRNTENSTFPQEVPRIKLNLPSLKIHLKTKPGFNPQNYSARTVNNTKGFRWRYLTEATIAERDSMDEFIDIYVKERIAFDRRKKDNNVLVAHMPDRFGKYEVLAHPDRPGKSIVHGIWDYRNKEKVHGAEWFYDGEPGEWVWPVLERDEDGYGYVENREDGDGRNRGELRVKMKKNKRGDVGKGMPLDGAVEAKGSAEMMKNGRKRGRGRMAVATPPPPPRLSLVPATRMAKRKAETLKTERPKRRAKTRRYGMGDYDDDSDDEYVP